VCGLEHCELSCDPKHGQASPEGKCICESKKWTGDDCSQEVPEDTNLIPSTITAIAYAMMEFNLLLIVFCGGWLYWKRNSSQVQVSQPFFLSLVLLGCAVSSSAIIAMGQEDPGDGPVRACMVRSAMWSGV
jgi:hypothetical protein